MEGVTGIWAYVFGVLAIIVPAIATYHIITSKDDVRAAIGWTGLVWLVPFIGTGIYLVFGINRIRRKALKVRQRGRGDSNHKHKSSQPDNLLPGAPPSVHAHIRLMDGLSNGPLSKGNRITPLEGGRDVYRAMAEAIDKAQYSVTFCSYIFGADEAGQDILKALIAARKRGIEVRVLIDGVGAHYSFRKAASVLRKGRVKVAYFNLSLWPWKMGFINLRNHRKVLVVDGKAGFTGGMNIRAGHILPFTSRRAVQDIHFYLEGPVVGQLQEAFAEDWVHSTGEALEGKAWFPEIARMKEGQALARALPDGPDIKLDRIRWSLLSGLDMAVTSVRIMTPYFLPDRVLVAALNQAALRGVEVTVLLPEHNNLPFVGWAARAQYDQILASGCRIFHSLRPFDHSKLMIVDEAWCLFGSSNWDPRSLRLNFELNVECFDEGLAHTLAHSFDKKVERATAVTLQDMQSRHPIKKARDGIFWLMSPYL